MTHTKPNDLLWRQVRWGREYWDTSLARTDDKGDGKEGGKLASWGGADDNDVIVHHGVAFLASVAVNGGKWWWHRGERSLST